MADAAAGRLQQGPAPELIASAYRWEVELAPILWTGLGLADLAHVVTLVEQEIVPPEAGRRLLRLLLDLHERPVDDFDLDPALGDVYTNREAWLAARDEAAAGWLRAGRARREATTTAFHLVVRNRVLVLTESILDYLRALLARAEAHRATVMPDYTYLQPAQPTTLAHYLLGFAHPALRDLARLRAFFRRVDRSPAGGGSTNGSRLPLDRRRIADLLGFDGVVHHPRDAMWQADLPVEGSAILVALVVNLDRLAEDLQVWCTREFGFVELSDAYARSSVIMPQKKNPYSLAFVRGVAGRLIGQTSAMAAVGKTPSGQVDNRIFAYRDVPRAMELATATVDVMAGVLGGLHVDAARMAQRANEDYTGATDLAEVVMQQHGLDYRTAHTIVGRAVRLALSDAENDAGTLSAVLLDRAAEEVIGRALALSEEELRSVLDPASIVAARTGLGGAAREPVQALLDDVHAAVDAAEEWQRTTTVRLVEAEDRLLRRARELADVG